MCASFLLFSSEIIARDLTHVLSEKASKTCDCHLIHVSTFELRALALLFQNQFSMGFFLLPFDRNNTFSFGGFLRNGRSKGVVLNMNPSSLGVYVFRCVV